MQIDDYDKRRWRRLVSHLAKSYREAFGKTEFPLSSLKMDDWETGKKLSLKDYSFWMDGFRIQVKNGTVISTPSFLVEYGKPLDRNMILKTAFLSKGCRLKPPLFMSVMDFYGASARWGFYFPPFFTVENGLDNRLSVFECFQDAVAFMLESPLAKALNICWGNGSPQTIPVLRVQDSATVTEKFETKRLTLSMAETLADFLPTTDQKIFLEHLTAKNSGFDTYGYTYRMLKNIQDFINRMIDENWLDIYHYCQETGSEYSDVKVIFDCVNVHSLTYKKNDVLEKDGSFILDWQELPPHQRSTAWKYVRSLIDQEGFMEETFDKIFAVSVPVMK